MKHLLISISSLVFFWTAGVSVAQEETLSFRLVVRNIEQMVLETGVEGKSMTAAKSAGVAIFEDGKVANKEFVGMVDGAGATGSFSGYSTYTFLSGDSLTLRYDGGWGSDGSSIDYKVLSGTGAYEGATGTGHLKGVKEPWDNANLFEGAFKLKRGG